MLCKNLCGKRIWKIIDICIAKSLLCTLETTLETNINNTVNQLSVQFTTPWTTACQVSLFTINSQSLLKLISIESVMPSKQLILCCLLIFMPSILPSIRVFSSESVLHVRWPNYWSFSFSISPFNEYSDWFPLGLIDWISLQSKRLSRVFSNTTVQKHQFFGTQLSL